MTVAELELKLSAMEAELILLRHEVLRLKSATVVPGFGPVGTFPDDPTFPDAVKFGKADRDKVNRDSLKASDRGKVGPGRSKRRKADARS
ncbi:MAG: hypothetical protein C0501_00355 [Isosphaera sp.]|nr:hypothetical protein [Isosphaera sp.]